MSTTEVRGVETAAMLHDVGKIGVPDYILSKPGPLTRDEFRRVRRHPEIGAGIIAAVPFPYPVAPYIRSHHERWDGSGYPDGLARDTIPLGARILSVVDYFDALVSDRPYHNAMSESEAVATLQAESGRALDPTVVSTFLTIRAALDAELSQAPPATAVALPPPGQARRASRRPRKTPSSSTSRASTAKPARCTRWPTVWARASRSTARWISSSPNCISSCRSRPARCFSGTRTMRRCGAGPRAASTRTC
jgi:hypothetical protein